MKRKLTHLFSFYIKLTFLTQFMWIYHLVHRRIDYKKKPLKYLLELEIILN
jgi:hypothetical protein